ncbi:hypothetical protein BBI01_09745 [Chryseobacterium artocarpi]|uniref:DUF3828 domain-containing protein n=1 Tax=Chryseobacterium artocarpi TaxID=1414727 RepID=A0A1B8ZLD4_9FLAO|nr:hypothetical protein [Chryseobacterium artocarpi]OCA72398.1 hypothetical protein BBI01_09745 [Chryseobacterium artocarpi]
MPRKTLLLSTVCLLFLHCKKQETLPKNIIQDTIKQQNTNNSHQETQDNSQIETVKSFLKWYRDNEEKLYNFNTIKGGILEENEAPENYYVDFDAVEKEIRFMERSNLFSQKFLSDYKQNYVKGDDHFKKDPANDGPPFGFDYDYFFKTQEDYQSDLKNIENIKFTVKQINSQQCFVEFHLKNCGMTYRYTLSKKNQWQIDSIENIS